MDLLVYSSFYTGDTNTVNQDLQDIERVSNSNNADANITGVLFYHRKRFVQVLEGTSSELDKLLLTLSQDDRHDNIEVILRDEIHERSYSGWNMDSFDLSSETQINVSRLRKVTDIFRQTLVADSKILVDFYKQMLLLA